MSKNRNNRGIQGTEPQNRNNREIQGTEPQDEAASLEELETVETGEEVETEDGAQVEGDETETPETESGDFEQEGVTELTPDEVSEESANPSVQNPTPEPVVLNLEKQAAAQTEQNLEREIPPVPEGVDATTHMSLEGVREYVKEMLPNKGQTKLIMDANRAFVENVAPQMQATLFSYIMNFITGSDDASFTKGMDYLMDLFTRFGGVDQPLNQLALHSYMENFPGDTSSANKYGSFVRIFTTLCNPATRQANITATIDLQATLNRDFTEAEGLRIISYFQGYL